MNRKQTIIVSIVLVLALLLFLTTVFTIKKVPIAKWKLDFKYESKEPYGAWMFRNMLEDYYDSTRVLLHHKDTILAELYGENMLYVNMGDYLHFSKEACEELDSFISKGNDALLISSEVYFYNDSLFNIPYYYNGLLVDSTLSLKFNDPSKNDFNYKHYFNQFENPTLGNFNFLQLDFDDNVDARIMAEVQDTALVYLRLPVGEGAISLFTLPMLLSNHAALQDGYLDFFNAVFEDFCPELIILDHPSFNVRDYEESSNESPLEYILKEASLSWAYYLLLLTCLLYVLSASKRRQSIIPTIAKNENTSLDYVKTISSLFMNQNQNNKLIPHIKRVFYQRIKKKYYLDKLDADFTKLLSRKSKIDEEEIDKIMSMLNSAEQNPNLDDEQLSKIYKRLESFYKNCK